MQTADDNTPHLPPPTSHPSPLQSFLTRFKELFDLKSAFSSPQPPMNIKDLLFNPTQFTIRDVQRLISNGVFTRQEVASVLKDEVFSYVEKSLSPKTSLPSVGQLLRIPKESNMVMVWGIRDAGKTSLIGSLFSLPGFKLAGGSKAGNQAVRSRYDALKKMTKGKGWQEIPCAENDAPIEMLETVYKPSWLGRTYPMTFVEVNLTKAGDNTTLDTSIDWVHLVKLMNNSIGHIHLFCLNCSQDTNTHIQSTLEQQAKHFSTVLNNLRSYKLIDSANAVYVVVTKADLMKAPKPYLDNAAQTLVTSTLSRFWQTVRNICYQKHIYNAQPLTCSLGTFALKDFAQIDTAYTEHIFYDNILRKCFPCKRLIERIFGFKKWWMKWVALILLAAAVIYGGYKAYGSLADTPLTIVQPFDYGAWFLKELQVFHKAGNVVLPNTYEDVRTHYYRLRKDLNTERALRTDSAQAVITDSIAYACDSALTTSFAAILQQTVTDFFNSSDWAKNHPSQNKKRDHLKWDLTPIKDNKFLNNNQRKLFTDRTKDLNELPKANSFVYRSKNCKSLSDINYVKSNCAKWKFPFTNDTQMKTNLDNAVRNAYNSCANHYCSEADTKLNLYFNEIRDINRRRYSNDERNKAINNAKIRLKNNTTWLINRMDELYDNTNYDDIKEKLKKKKATITDITKNITNNNNNNKKGLFGIF